MAWPSQMACAVIGRETWCHVPRCISCWSGSVVDVLDGCCVKLANPVVMSMLAWNWLEMGTHPRGNEFVMCGRRYRYFFILRPWCSYIWTVWSLSHMYSSAVCGSIAIFHNCMMHPRYHLPRGWIYVLLVPSQKLKCNSRCHVFQTGFAGFVWMGNVNWLVRGKSCPSNAHAHMDHPLLVHISAKVVTPKYSWHHCAWTSSFVVIPGIWANASIMK